jgi:WhiB family redox-sensing transcriptional regulator
MSAQHDGPSFATWIDRAACRTLPISWWFPESADDVRTANKALAVCQRCDVRTECLQFALDNDDRHGIFGGLYPYQRYQMKHKKTLRKDRQWLR